MPIVERVVVTLVHGEPLTFTSDGSEMESAWATFQRAIDARAEWVTFINPASSASVRMQHIASIYRYAPTGE